MGSTIFPGTNPSFTISYLASYAASGFTTPTWQGYPAIPIDGITRPAAGWLLSHQLPVDADLNGDPNGDGVSLRMAFALNLNPHLNLQNALPAPVLSSTSLSLNYFGASPGIFYAVETSTDLINWTSQGVSYSAPRPDGIITARVARGAAGRYLRLAVSE